MPKTQTDLESAADFKTLRAEIRQLSSNQMGLWAANAVTDAAVQYLIRRLMASVPPEQHENELRTLFVNINTAVSNLIAESGTFEENSTIAAENALRNFESRMISPVPRKS